MKKAILLVFSIILRLTWAQTESQVTISDWVVEPTESSLEKPLVFIDFWATWCGPCINAMSYTKFLNAEFKNDVLFLHLSDEDPDKINQFMSEKGFDFYSATDESNTSLTEYGIKRLPNSVIIDPYGAVIWRGSPTDLKRDALKTFVNRYKHASGLPSRFKVLALEDSSSSLNLFTLGSDSIYFERDTSGVHNLTSEGGERQISGDIKRLYSYVMDVPSYLINVESELGGYRFVSRSHSESDFKLLIKSFLDAQFNLVTSLEHKGVYIISKGDSLSFTDASFYDYELGYAASMEDGVSLMIDNARPDDAINLLAEVSSYPFVYRGNHSSIYDWSFFYGRRESLFDQLTNELGFKVRYEQIPLTVYFISKK